MSAADRVTELTAAFGAPSLDVAGLLCDQHPADRVAFTVVDGTGGAATLTFGKLATDSHRYARALQGLGVGPGDRVATLMGKSTDLVTLILATWRLGAVYVPLFTAFAPQAIALRLEGSGAHVVVVDPDQRHKLDPGPDMPDAPQRRIVVTGTGTSRGDLSLADLVAAASPEPVPAVTTNGDGPLVHMFTSGTTGKPKGVIHPVSYIAGWQIYLEYALGVTQDSNYWCAADPGWAYGLYAAIVAPLAAGIPSLLLSGGFSPETTWRTLLDHQVTDFTAAPTVYRGLRSSPVPVPQGLRLQRASSAGEPLTPEVNEWADAALGLAVHDHFGQTEVGMPLANHHHPELARPLKAGSMGRPVPGWSLTVLAEEKDKPAGRGVLGRVAIDVAASPLMTFRDYQIPGQSDAKFTADGRYYLTGDAGRVDADGDFFFSSRDDDVIIMAGYRIGPFEIESVLAQHPAVAECSVIGAPDDVRGEVIEAYVVLRDGGDGSPELATELQQLVKTRYAAHAYPRSIHFIDALPKTPSGKTQRYLLRNRRRTELATPGAPLTDTEPLLVEQRGTVRWLLLNRPERRNALDVTLVEALDKQITSAEADPGTAVIAVAGRGPSFCAGGDFHQFLQLHERGENPVDFLTDVSACFSRIAASPKPWVAVLHGHAVAGGLELALACDVVVAADTTLIGDGHLNRRLVPAGGSSVRLPGAVGRGLSRWLLLTGELLPATAFANTGWIHAIVPEADLDATAMRICHQLADRHSPAQQRLKTLLHRIDGMAPELALREELATFADNWTASSVADALRAFLTPPTTKADTK